MQKDFTLIQQSFKRSVKRRNKSDIQTYLNRIQPLIHLNHNQNYNQNQKKSFINRKILYNSERNKKIFNRNVIKTEPKENIFMSTFTDLNVPIKKYQQRLYTQSSLQSPTNRNRNYIKKNQTFSNMNIIKINEEVKIQKKIYSVAQQFENDLKDKSQTKKAIHVRNQVQIKAEIKQKIKNYVRKLDVKGQEQLNNLLLNNLKRQKKSHIDSQMTQHKIKEMIKNNKFIVHMIKQELLSQDDVDKVGNKELVNQNSSDNLKKQSRANSLLQNYQTFEENSNHNSPNHNNDHSNMTQVSKQFFNEWEKGIAHKKTIYNKFRRTLFEQFPIFAERQVIYNKEHKKEIQFQKTKQNIFDVDKSLFSPINHRNQHNAHNTSALLEKYSTKQIQVQPEGYQRKNSISLSQKSGNKLFSLRRSLSKKSKDSRQYSETYKHQREGFSFDDAVQYVFKKAYFYSVSKDKVLQTYVDISPQIKIISPIQKEQNRPGELNFLDFLSKKRNKSSGGSKHIMCQKTNSTGKYLIKNKQKIMNIRKEGDQKYEFLKKCLQDAIQSYVQLNNCK